MAQEWYYSVGGAERQGPISAAELKKLADAGNLNAGDLVWKEGMAEWAPAKSIKGLFTNPAPAAAPATAAEPARARPRPEPDEEDRPSARDRRKDPDDEFERPRRRRDLDDDRDEDDRPSGRMRRRDPDDSDHPDDDRPRRRRDDDTDEESDHPRRKRRRAPEDAGSKKLAVSLVAILTAVVGLGWIGIHKFMLGKTTAGLIMLLGSILTCGIGLIVFNLISLIEGIIYLTKSDEEFFETYVVGDKDWF